MSYKPYNQFNKSSFGKKYRRNVQQQQYSGFPPHASDPGGGVHLHSSAGYDPSIVRPFMHHHGASMLSMAQNNKPSNRNAHHIGQAHPNLDPAMHSVYDHAFYHNLGHHPLPQPSALPHDSWSLADSCDSIEERVSPTISMPVSSTNAHIVQQPQSNLNHYGHHHHATTSPSSDHIKLKDPAWIKVKQYSFKSPDLLIRTAWFDAETALDQIEKGKAQGNGTALWLRFMIQARFFDLGQWIQKKAGAIIFIAALILIVCLAGLKSVRIEDNVENLWIEEGGRLAKELQYVRNTLGDGYGTTNQIVIQTPKHDHGSVLNPSALLFHLKALRTAITTSVEMFDSTWNLKDICYTPSSPVFDKHHIDSLFENIFPCSIITPLDCFWEGSKLLGPEIPVKIPILNHNVQWTDLNPQQLVDMITIIKQSTTEMSSSSGHLQDGDVGASNSMLATFETIQKFMKRAGITTAYQSKPCLDPMDPECPITAPNKHSAQPPNIGSELTDGCYGFATKYMHRIEDLIVGGVTKNRSGQIVQAKALQSIVQLMGEQNMFEFYRHTIKVQNVPDWSMDKARAILQAWQRKFSEELERFTTNTDFVGSQQYNIHHFTSASMTDIMRNFSEVNFVRLAIGYLLMMLYAAYSLSRWRKKSVRMERSQSILAMLGVLVIGLAVASGLGVCALIGLPFNASTTQIVPFLALGLGIDHMFILAHAYTTDYMIIYVPHQFRTAECLKQTGFSILLSSIGNIVAFCSAAIIPIPALRCFSLQSAILIAFICVAVIILFPALASLDLRFRLLYLMETGHTSSQSSLSTSFFINMCFYLCCCRTPHFAKVAATAHRSSTDQELMQISVSSRLSNFGQAKSQTTTTTESLFEQPYIFQQPCNFVRLNSNTSSIPSEEDVYRPSAHGKNQICRCEQSLINDRVDGNDLIGAEESRFKLMRQCNQCGGDLRTQCDGQDDGDDCHEDVSSSTANTVPKMADLSDSVIGSSSQQPPISQVNNDLTNPTKKNKFKFSTTHCISEYLVPMLERGPIKLSVLLVSIASVIVSLIGIIKVNDGLDLIDIVPRETNEYRFLQLQKQYFSYYNVFAVTKGNFDYPNNQRLLYEYHQSFNRVDAIIKNDDGGLPEFWLPMFRDWLKDLQEAFDHDSQRGCITREQWFSNASTEAILAYKLLVQTGRNDNPVDKSLILTNRLVDNQGIINPKAFYNYLTAWVSNDVMAYQASQASFKPEPRQWIHEAQDVELKILKSPALIFTQIPFHLNNIRTTEEIVQTIQDVRSICSRFEDRGLPNFPTGIPFTYWEQYIRLRFNLIITLVVVLAGIFFSISILTCSLWTAIIIIAHLILHLVQLFGFMGWIGIKFSALPAVILIISIAVSHNSLVYITISFNTAIGNRNRRMLLALQHMANPVKHGIISTLFGLIMLAFSEFDFIIRYYFLVLGASLLIVAFNSFMLLPVTLSVIGPKPEVIPLEHEDRLSTPTPPPSPVSVSSLIKQQNNIDSSSNNCYVEALMRENHHRQPKISSRGSIFNRYRQQRKELQRIQSQLSLSTISEEPSSYQSTPGATPTPNATPISYANQCSNAQPSSLVNVGGQAQQHEFVVQPEFVVETTITNNGSHHTNNKPIITTTVNNKPSEHGQSSVSKVDSPSPNSSMEEQHLSNVSQQQQSSTTVTTKVMATAKLTVELHTPSPTPTPSTSNIVGGQSYQSGIAKSSSIIDHQSLKADQHPSATTLVSFPGANYHGAPHHHHHTTPTQEFYMAPSTVPAPYHHASTSQRQVSGHFHPQIICARNPSYYLSDNNNPDQSSSLQPLSESRFYTSLRPNYHHPSNAHHQNWR